MAAPQAAPQQQVNQATVLPKMLCCVCCVLSSSRLVSSCLVLSRLVSSRLPPSPPSPLPSMTPCLTLPKSNSTSQPNPTQPTPQPKPESFNEAVQRAGLASRSERSRRKSSKAAAADEGDYGRDDDAGGYQKTPMMNHYGGGPSGRGRSGSGMGGGRSSSMSSTSSMTMEEHLAWLNKINSQIQQGESSANAAH